MTGITAWTLTPIDLGAGVAPHDGRTMIDRIIRSYGWEPTPYGYGRRDERLYLRDEGILVHMLRWDAPDDPILLCRERRSLHHGIMDGTRLTPDLPRMLHGIRRALREHTPVRRRRYMSDKLVEYSFTLLECDETPAPDALRLLLDPSLIGMQDSPGVTIPDSVTAADANDGRRIIEADDPDVEGALALHSTPAYGMDAWASWSTLIITGHADPGAFDRVLTVESEIQSSWLAAWICHSMCSTILMMPARHVDPERARWQRFEFDGLDDAGRRGNASESRSMGMFRHSLAVTSGLDGEWEQAHSDLDRVSSLCDLISGERERRRDTVWQILALLFSLLSLVQVLYAMPLQMSWGMLASDPVRALTLFAVLLIGLVLVLGRRG